MKYNDLEVLLGSKIEAGNDVAIPYIRSFGKPAYRAHDEVENVVSIVVRDPNSTDEMVEAACQAFLDIGTDGSWVHSLSHFTGRLWEKRDQFLACLPWIKKFNEVAFVLANRGNKSCCDRLVCDFGEYSRAEDDPAEFHLTPDNLSWMSWQYCEQAKARIELGHCTKDEFDKFSLVHQLRRRRFNYKPEGFDEELVNVNLIEKALARLKELAVDTSEFVGLAEQLLRERLKSLEDFLESLPKIDHWSVTEKAKKEDSLLKAIAKTNEDLSRVTAK